MKNWIKIYRLISEIDLLYNERKYLAAITSCEKILAYDAKNLTALNRKGLALKALGQFKEAIEYFDAIVQLEPKDWTNWYNKGLSHKALGENSKAIECFNKVIELNPAEIKKEIWHNKCLALKALERDKEAIECYEKALELGLKEDSMLLGDSYSEEQKYEQAAQCYGNVLKLDPEDDIIWNKQGDAYKAQGNLAEALNCYDKAITLVQKKRFWARLSNNSNVDELRTKEEILFEMRGTLLERQGKYAEAVKCYEEAFAKNYYRVCIHLGRLYHFGLGVKQEYAEAYRYYQQAAEHNLAAAQASLGILFERGLGTSKNYQTAFSWYSKANEQKHPWAKLGMSLLHLRGLVKIDNDKFDAESLLEASKLDEIQLDEFHDFINWNKTLADNNQLDACVWLGAIYEHGLLHEKSDIQLACIYYQKAGERNDVYSNIRAEQLQKKTITQQLQKKTIESPKDSPKASPNMVTTAPQPLNLINISGDFQLSLAIPHAEITFHSTIGSGSFGQVYKGTWRHMDIAIKRLHVMQLSEEIINEFKQEATIMARLRSSFIIQLYGLVLDTMPYCIVMEYMVNGSLYNYLHSTKAIDWPQRLQIAKDMACGLAYLHAEKILHRDLKSLNVLLDNRLRAKLADFGLSKLKIETLTSTRQENIGTLMWMAPELFQRHSRYTTASDIYSYGIILWELATRKLPFADAYDRSLIREWVVKGEREEIPATCPSHFASLIEECWSGDVQKRPNTSQIIARLEANAALLAEDSLVEPIQHLSLVDSYQANVASLANFSTNLPNSSNNLASQNLHQLKPTVESNQPNQTAVPIASNRQNRFFQGQSNQLSTQSNKRGSWPPLR